MKKDYDKAYLVHIRECIDILPVHLSLLPSGTVWHEHVTVRDAILRTLQLMSESCQRLSEATKTQIHGMNWGKISGFRNILVHDYLGDRIDYALVTEIMEMQLPQLKAEVTRVYKERYAS